MSWIERFTERVATTLDYFVTFLMAALLIEVLFLILGRQVGLSWVWLYDVTRWTLAWLVFVGAVPLARRGAHLAVDVAANALPPWAQSGSRALGAVGTAAVAGLVAYYGGEEAFRMYESGERSMSGLLPAFVGYGVLPVAFTLLALAGVAFFFSTRPTPPETL
jgi:TRAP-type C4-dicarboxylate transport system permease small subunit